MIVCHFIFTQNIIVNESVENLSTDKGELGCGKNYNVKTKISVKLRFQNLVLL